MQLTNFEIDNGFTTLFYNGSHLDLHNNFDFTLLNHDKVSGVARVTFNRRSADWIHKTDPGSLTLLFTNVSHIFLKEHDPDYLQEEAKTIDMIGFSYGDDEIMDGVTNNIPGEALPAMLIVFVTGKAVKIVADSVELHADQ